MKLLTRWLATGLMAGLSSFALAGGQPPVLADFAAVPRLAGHVDVDKLTTQLQQMKANTYMWLVWHSQYDWSDLRYFLPKAKAAGIDVWVYLVPHSETPAGSSTFKLYSEPYRTDYVQWAAEIARLSLQHSNLKGYVIDDFVENMIPGRFTADYINRMQQAGKSINPALRFYPLVYVSEVNESLMDTLGPKVDGVVAAYPPNAQSVRDMVPFLKDNYVLPERLQLASRYGVDYPAGDGAFAVQRFAVKTPAQASLQFQFADDYHYFREGEKYLVVQLDGQTIWQEDVARYDKQQVSIDLASRVAGKQYIKLAIGLWDAKLNRNLGVSVILSGLSTPGLVAYPGGSSALSNWQFEKSNRYNAQWLAARRGTGRFNLPTLVMLPAEKFEFQKRTSLTATPSALGSKLRELNQLVQTGLVDGVVTYCLDKSEGNPFMKEVANVYANY